MNKYYFTDVGIRNALIGDFNSPDIRGDIGGLFENFAYIERVKSQNYQNLFANNYYWRRSNGHEIDLIEERDGRLFATEYKFSNRLAKKVKLPSEFAQEYGVDKIDIITSENIVQFETNY